MRKRDLKLSKYGIGPKRYAELRAFCEQYPEWKQFLASETNTVKSKVITDMPLSRDPMSNATENLAFRRSVHSCQCDLIERVAKQASEDLYEYIIKSACYELPVRYLIMVDNMPCSAATLYDMRRYFFYLLDIEKIKYELWKI